ncbi:MAG: hypothetical protein AABY22_20140 [Nanoarchaeota archaeon]
MNEDIRRLKKLEMKQKAAELYHQMQDPSTRKVSELLLALYGIKRSHAWVATAIQEVEK